MSFAFNEPTATHPTPAVEDGSTVEEKVDDAGTGSGNPGTGITDEGNNPDAGNSSDTRGDDTDGESPPETGAEAEAPPEENQPQSDTPEVSYYFGGEEVSVEVDPTHREAFSAKGLDIDALAAELYSKDGGFKLSDESYQKCCEAFGKFAIDAFISGLKAQNEGTVNSWKQAAEVRAKADEDRFSSLAATIGGDSGWSRLEEYALATLTDEELAGFNEVMSSGNQYLQQFALRELEGRRKGAQGDDSVTLIEGKASLAGNEDSAPLNARDYIKATAELGNKFPHDKAGYAKAQAQLDARRRAGLASGL